MDKVVGIKRTVYIAGGITGLPEENINAFSAAQAYLTDKGYNVFNPHEICKGLKPEMFKSPLAFWQACMRKNSQFLQMADTIYLLKGWEQSRGALKELADAINNNLEVIISDKF